MVLGFSLSGEGVGFVHLQVLAAPQVSGLSAPQVFGLSSVHVYYDCAFLFMCF